MKVVRITLSAVLGITLFFSTSAISQMRGVQGKSTDGQNQILAAETEKNPISILAEVNYAGIDRSTDAEEQLFQSSADEFVLEQQDAQPFQQLEQFGLIEESQDASPKPEISKIQKARAFTCSESDRLLIARVVYAESRGEKFEGQVAVATVVFNRYYSGKYGSTIKKIVFAPDQFAIGNKYTQTSLKAVDAAMLRTGDYPENMFYFRTSKSHVWRNFVYYTRIGGHSFYLGAE